MSATPLHRTLDQELTALARGVSLECLVCGEFVLHARHGVIACPECGSSLVDGLETVAAEPAQQRLPVG
jgi:Zn finger protein HypA/HybF involved in hydrogenase expression